MLLRQLRLHNIRSYAALDLELSEGSTLLCGDIGCGKSTLLLAIEFALFGISKPDLPGEALLRKGAVNGSVELSFRLKDKEIIIKRNLKKDKEAIKQTSGHIIINDIKKELTPVELKSEIFSLLGYPEELVSKNKNYIYHYTVYTPQEEMKLILQDNPEERLDVLRKIFNIDKYKNIRENLQIYLKQMRTTLAIMETKIEPLVEHEQQLDTLHKEKELLHLQLKELSPKLEDSRTRLQSTKKELDQLEKKQSRYQEAQLRIKTLSERLNDKKEQLMQQEARKEVLHKQLQDLIVPPEFTAEKIKFEADLLELKKNNYLRQKTTLQEQVSQIQRSINELQQLIQKTTEQLAAKTEKEQALATINAQILPKEQLKQEKTLLEQQSESIVEILSRQRLLLSQSKELDQKIASMETCPTCLQQVSPEHKHSISTAEQQKINMAQQEINKSEAEREKVGQRKQQVLTQIENILHLENQATRLKTELKNLQEKEAQLEQHQQLLKLKAQENNQLMANLGKLIAEDQTIEINQKLNNLNELQRKIMQKNMLEQQHNQIEEQLKNISANITALSESKHLTEKEASELSDLSTVIEEQKKVVSESMEIEKQLSIIQAQINSNHNNIHRQEQPLLQVIAALKEIQQKLTPQKELYHWLEDFFIPLTITMEKQTMIRIHHLFNQLFQEWFGILIDDENIYSRLDESFTPIIEQNGYEITFSNLSGGEKTSAALAYRLSLNKVINDVIHDIKTKDLLILDEPTDGFSSEQLDKVKEVLDRLKLKQIIIVSHESKIETFVENIIRVRKEGNVSVIS